MLVIILAVSVLATIGLDMLWSDGWRLMHISLLVNHLYCF